MSQVSKEKSIPPGLPVVEPAVEPSFADRLLESARPHANLIILSVAALFLLFIAVAWIIQSRQSVAEGEWMSFNQQLSVLSMTGNTSGMKELAEEYPEGSAGLWGLQLAGHFELDQGIRKLGVNRAEGLKEIEKSVTTLKKVVDAPAAQKSTLLQVRSTYTLAYAYESLGDFESAKSLYQKLVDQAPESAFGQAATRGLTRCSDPAFAKVYQRFKDWEDPFAVAPGTPPTEKPDISFPELPDTSGDPEKKEESKPEAATEPPSEPSKSEAPATGDKKETEPAPSPPSTSEEGKSGDN